MYKRYYLFRMNIMEEIFEIRSCIEILAHDIKIYTTDQRMFYSTLGVEKLGIPQPCSRMAIEIFTQHTAQT